MKKNIHFFSENEFIKNPSILEKIGGRNREANNFASLKLPVVPGFAIDSDAASSLESGKIIKFLNPYIDKIETQMGKKFNAEVKPLTLKIIVSPNLTITSSYPALHNFGITRNTFDGFSKLVGENFAYNELFFLLKGILIIEEKIAVLEEDEKKADSIKKLLISSIQSLAKKSGNQTVRNLFLMQKILFL